MSSDRFKGEEESGDDYWNQSSKSASIFDENFDFEIDVRNSESNQKRSQINANKENGDLKKYSSSQIQNVSSIKVTTDNESGQVVQDFIKSQLSVTSATEPKRTSAKDFVMCAIINQNYNFHELKSEKDKLDLLDFAIKSHDGNVITAAILFLRQTLISKIFNYQLSKRPEAVNHYLSYLQQFNLINDLVDTLTMLGRYEEAAIVKYSQAIQSKNIDTKVKNLQNCKQNYFNFNLGGGLNDSFGLWNTLISEQISLLERQQPIELEDVRQANQVEVHSEFLIVPRKSILNQSIITTLYYCCLYHYELTENNFASPKSITKAYQLSEKQFLWSALNALSQFQKWSEIDALFEQKSWLGSKKVKTILPFHKVAKILYKSDAPSELLVKYVKFIEDEDIKLSVAQEFRLHQIVIETLVSMKDRLGLRQYMSKLDERSKDYLYAQNILESFTVKWKN